MADTLNYDATTDNLAYNPVDNKIAEACGTPGWYQAKKCSDGSNVNVYFAVSCAAPLIGKAFFVGGPLFISGCPGCLPDCLQLDTSTVITSLPEGACVLDCSVPQIFDTCDDCVLYWPYSCAGSGFTAGYAIPISLGMPASIFFFTPRGQKICLTAGTCPVSQTTVTTDGITVLESGDFTAGACTPCPCQSLCPDDTIGQTPGCVGGGAASLEVTIGEDVFDVEPGDENEDGFATWDSLGIQSCTGCGYDPAPCNITEISAFYYFPSSGTYKGCISISITITRCDGATATYTAEPACDNGSGPTILTLQSTTDGDGSCTNEWPDTITASLACLG